MCKQSRSCCMCAASHGAASPSSSVTARQVPATDQRAPVLAAAHIQQGFSCHIPGNPSSMGAPSLIMAEHTTAQALQQDCPWRSLTKCAV